MVREPDRGSGTGRKSPMRRRRALADRQASRGDIFVLMPRRILECDQPLVGNGGTDKPMKARTIAIMITTALFFSSCKTTENIDTSQRAISGKVMHLTEWKSIQPHELVVNISDLEGVSILRAQQQVRDNQIIKQRAWLGLSDGHDHDLDIQYGVGTWLFKFSETKRLNSEEKFKETVSKYYMKQNLKVIHEETRKVYRHGDRGGWLSSVRTSGPAQYCILARIGFLSDSTKFLPVGELYDTIVLFRDCSRKRSLDDIEAFLNGMKIIPS